MESASDLDINSDEQASFTGEVEKHGQEFLDDMFAHVGITFAQLTLKMLSSMPLKVWQRWCYELDQRSKGSPESAKFKSQAESAWLFVQYLQASKDQQLKDARSPWFQEIADGLGVKGQLNDALKACDEAESAAGHAGINPRV